MTVDDAVAGIAATITSRGLKCHPVRDDGDYPDGIKISDARMKHLEDQVLERNAFHGEWNYGVLPVPRPGPEPEPGPARPGRVPQDVLNHPALTGMQPEDLTALARALKVPFGALRAKDNYRRRGGERTTGVRDGGGSNGQRRIDVTDRVLALRLRQHLNLPTAAVGALLGVTAATISHAACDAAAFIADRGIPVPTAAPPAELPRTPAELLAYATQAGIPLTIPENGHRMPDRFSARKSKSSATRPKQTTK